MKKSQIRDADKQANCAPGGQPALLQGLECLFGRCWGEGRHCCLVLIVLDAHRVLHVSQVGIFWIIIYSSEAIFDA